MLVTVEVIVGRQGLRLLAVWMNVMFAKDLVGQGVILGEGFVVPMAVSASVGPAFRLERRSLFAHRDLELP
jgi:hypothetical protein